MYVEKDQPMHATQMNTIVANDNDDDNDTERNLDSSGHSSGHHLNAFPTLLRPNIKPMTQLLSQTGR